MNWTQGERVYSTVRGCYEGIPGTVIGRCKVYNVYQPGRDYNIALDSGLTVRIDGRDLAPVTPEIEEAYRKRAEEYERINQRTAERNKRIEEASCRHREALEARNNRAAEEEAQARQSDHDAARQRYKDERAREYGLHSLRGTI